MLRLKTEKDITGSQRKKVDVSAKAISFRSTSVFDTIGHDYILHFFYISKLAAAIFILTTKTSFFFLKIHLFIVLSLYLHNPVSYSLF